MSKESVLQVRIDTDLKEAAEALYGEMDTSLAEAVRIFARQSVIARGMPFSISAPSRRKPSMMGAFSDYVRPGLREKEKSAFARAIEAKHAHTA